MLAKMNDECKDECSLSANYRLISEAEEGLVYRPARVDPSTALPYDHHAYCLFISIDVRVLVPRSRVARRRREHE
jgi:hypothetical protein